MNEQVIVDPWMSFLKIVNCEQNPDHVHSGKANVFKKWLLEYAKEGSESSLNIIIELVTDAQNMKTPVLGQRKCRNLILRSSNEKSIIFKYFSEGMRHSDVQIIISTVPASKKYEDLRILNRTINYKVSLPKLI